MRTSASERHAEGENKERVHREVRARNKEEKGERGLPEDERRRKRRGWVVIAIYTVDADGFDECCVAWTMDCGVDHGP